MLFHKKLTPFKDLVSSDYRSAKLRIPGGKHFVEALMNDLKKIGGFLNYIRLHAKYNDEGVVTRTWDKKINDWHYTCKPNPNCAFKIC